MDSQLPAALDGFLQRATIVVCILTLVTLVFPWFFLPVLFMAGLFWLIYLMFRGALRRLKLLESQTRAPIYSAVSETLGGISVIKAFQKQSEFLAKFCVRIDEHSAANYLYFASMRWLSTRMDLLCVLLTLFSALFALYYKSMIGPAFAGMVIALSMQVWIDYRLLIVLMILFVILAIWPISIRHPIML